MKVQDMIDTLRMPKRFEIRDSENNEICVTSSDSDGVLPYLDRTVKQWFPYRLTGAILNLRDAEICILLEDKEEVADE